jgi:hypothetical protein
MTWRQHMAVICWHDGWLVLLLSSVLYLISPMPTELYPKFLGIGASLIGLGHWLGLPHPE